jgi:hypothetical protein
LVSNKLVDAREIWLIGIFLQNIWNLKRIYNFPLIHLLLRVWPSLRKIAGVCGIPFQSNPLPPFPAKQFVRGGSMDLSN